MTQQPIAVNCLICSEPITGQEIDAARHSKLQPIHGACQALGVVGHTFGVCTCTGFKTDDRGTALELWYRLLGMPFRTEDEA
jgi:hypothetical protein